MTTFFTSDLHVGHESILKKVGKGRPFETIQEMDDELVRRWNAVVQPNDTVYCLGDMAFRQSKGEFANFFKQVNGVKHLIIGNHDDEEVIKQPWISTSLIKEIKISGHKVVLCHYPMRSWNGMYRKSLHLYGHEHGNIPDYANCLDVGVDAWNYTPASFEQILERMSHLKPLPIEHTSPDKQY